MIAVRLRCHEWSWALAAFTIVACNPLQGDTRLSNSHPNADALGEAVLTALERGDRDSLEHLLVTRGEHETLLWSALPESNHLPFEYARSLNMRNSRKALDHAFRSYAQTEFEFVKLEFTEPPEEYDGFTLHHGARLRVKRVSDGKDGYLPILDVVLEFGGHWKPLNYKE